MGANREHIHIALGVCNDGGDRETVAKGLAAELNDRIQAIAQESRYKDIYLHVESESTVSPPPPTEEVAAARQRQQEDDE